MAALWGSLTLLSFHSLSLHLRRYLTNGKYSRIRLCNTKPRKAYAGRFQKTAGKRTGPITKIAALEASVHPVRNRLCNHFFLYQTNESCSQSVSKRRMLLRRLINHVCGLQLQMLPRLNGHFIVWFCT